MPDPTPSSAPTTTPEGAKEPVPAAGTNGGASPAGGAQNPAQGNDGKTPDGAAPGVGQAGSGGPSPAGSAEKKALELKVPDGWKDEAATAQFKKAAEELGLDAGKAQPLFDLFVSREKAEADALAQAQSEWLTAAKADKEIGGAAFEANSLLAKKAMVRFGGESLQKWLQETGLGNHLELVRAFVRIGKAMSEDSIAGTGGGLKTASNDPDTFIKSLYPNSPSMWGG